MPTHAATRYVTISGPPSVFNASACVQVDFAHDKTNNLPRYLGVRHKRGVPALKIVTAA